MQLSHATNFGEWISTHWYSFQIYQKSEKTGLSPHQPAHLHPTPDIHMDYLQCLDVYFPHHPHSEGLFLHEILPNAAVFEDHNPCISCILAVLDPSLTTKLNQISTSDMILDHMFTAKETCSHHQRNNILGWIFGVPFPNHCHVVVCPSRYHFRTSAHVKYHPPIYPPT